MEAIAACLFFVYGIIYRLSISNLLLSVKPLVSKPMIGSIPVFESDRLVKGVINNTIIPLFKRHGFSP
jgi:hypothetical protein